MESSAITSLAVRRNQAGAPVPPLENGAHLSAREFLRRFEAMPEVKKAELVNGIVYLGSPVRLDQHGEPDNLMQTWLARDLGFSKDRYSVRLRRMTYEQLPDERKEWIALAPLERFRRSEELFAQYLAMGGSLDPDPDPTSLFDVSSPWRPDTAHGRGGLRLLRRGVS